MYKSSSYSTMKIMRARRLFELLIKGSMILIAEDVEN